MAKKKSVYICQQCGYQSPSYLGKCPECGNWGTLVEQLDETTGPAQKRAKMAEIVQLSDIERRDYDRITTRINEFDRVLGGGIVLGSLVLVAGDPGIGKSTLLSQLSLNVEKTLYVAGEESAQQIKFRIDRIKDKAKLAVINETDVDVIIGAIEQVKPPLVIVDSIQTLETSDLESAAGSIAQVRESAHRLQKVAKKLHVPIFIVGHVTKEGSIAGPRTLEHLVDVVLTLEGDPTSNFRVLRAVKNRFGPTDEVGIFEMEETGMKQINNPSEVFLSEKVNAPGSAIVAVLSGYRPILLEIQALVTKTFAPIPRRVGTGIDNNRLQLLVAVISKRLQIPLYDQDVFVNVTGGIKVVEPAADLAICMAIISSFKDLSLDPKSVYIGEVGLLGELRTVKQLDKRMNEAKKLGYTTLVCPPQLKSLSEVVRKLPKK